MDIRHQKERVTKSATFEMIEEATGEKLRVAIVQDVYGINIKPEGYGEGLFPITLDFFKGSADNIDDPLRILVWADPENEDPSDVVSLRHIKNKEGSP